MITKKDLIDIAILLSKGYSIQESLKIIGNYEEIIERLFQGEKIETFIDINAKDQFNQSLSFFLKISTLDKAVISAYEYDEFKKNIVTNWIKEISYPIFVSFFSLIVFIFFEIYIYPQLSLFVQSSEGIQIHELINIMIKFFLIFLCIFICTATILFILIKKSPNLYIKIYEKYIGKSKIMKKTLSYDYALHSLVLMKRGLSTKQVFDSMFQLKSNPNLRYSLTLMIHHLKNGMNMIDVIQNHLYFDQKFKQFYKIGYYTQNLENTLYDYCNYQQEEFKKYLRYSSKIISTISYMFIALFVISIYQLLLLPLDMIHQF